MLRHSLSQIDLTLTEEIWDSFCELIC